VNVHVQLLNLWAGPSQHLASGQLVLKLSIHDSPHMLVLLLFSSRLLFFGCFLPLQRLFILKHNSLCSLPNLSLVRSRVVFGEFPYLGIQQVDDLKEIFDCWSGDFDVPPHLLLSQELRASIQDSSQPAFILGPVGCLCLFLGLQLARRGPSRVVLISPSRRPS
jgi:hypothetical protein